MNSSDRELMEREQISLIEVVEATDTITCFKVSWKTYKEPYLLKRISQSVFSKDVFEERMKLYHPNIINKYRYWSYGIYYYYLVDFIQDNIADIVKRHGPLQENMFLNYAQSMLESLNFFHMKRIFFKNILPANYLVDKHNRIRMCDIREMELVSNYKSSNDVFMLGQIFYYMISGVTQDSHGFIPRDQLSDINAFVNNITFPRKISGEVKDLIRRCLNFTEESSIFDILQCQAFKHVPPYRKNRNSVSLNPSATPVAINFNMKPIAIKCGRMI
ncbi:protein kinase, putative [Trichomonas vaginalis G3]|uniref:Protein kinase, putative n=1 Tax=Trichomonas vaginalis (strain ATCC PRA-98 / G3) TaxID=412133 RepID=A2FQ49_TRIV3|nr:histone serine kinase protein [Trichomonas vaginalis G3]EAX92956.1 protein kinase, putative [Trichomonas vaginalis G3]KAI5512345.1 histone serine kinase protein [Trichomonas vaginalis G3]|eukprot:XP_001305886.1 protein kinase [Trichomonas vaginalis G3]